MWITIVLGGTGSSRAYTSVRGKGDTMVLVGIAKRAHITPVTTVERIKTNRVKHTAAEITGKGFVDGTST